MRFCAAAAAEFGGAVLLLLDVAVGVAGIPACAHAPRARAAEESVASALDDFHDAAAKADEDRYFAHFAPGGVFLGTDATERWEVPAFRAYAHPHFAKGKAWTFRAARRIVTVRGDMAWFDEDLETQNLGPHDGKWLIDQYVLSITVPNERFRAVRDLFAAPKP
jgi:hypothetical protein